VYCRFSVYIETLAVYMVLDLFFRMHDDETSTKRRLCLPCLRETITIYTNVDMQSAR